VLYGQVGALTTKYHETLKEADSTRLALQKAQVCANFRPKRPGSPLSAFSARPSLAHNMDFHNLSATHSFLLWLTFHPFTRSSHPHTLTHSQARIADLEAAATRWEAAHTDLTFQSLAQQEGHRAEREALRLEVNQVRAVCV
jgi:hypothetical protein